MTTQEIQKVKEVVKAPSLMTLDAGLLAPAVLSLKYANRAIEEEIAMQQAMYDMQKNNIGVMMDFTRFNAQATRKAAEHDASATRASGISGIGGAVIGGGLTIKGLVSSSSTKLDDYKKEMEPIEKGYNAISAKGDPNLAAVAGQQGQGNIGLAKARLLAQDHSHLEDDVALVRGDDAVKAEVKQYYKDNYKRLDKEMKRLEQDASNTIQSHNQGSTLITNLAQGVGGTAQSSEQEKSAKEKEDQVWQEANKQGAERVMRNADSAIETQTGAVQNVLRMLDDLHSQNRISA